MKRTIDSIFTSYDLPTVVLIGGIHGNETTGITAIASVFNEIREKNIQVNGNIFGYRGNLKALQANERFLDHDLNRAWREPNLKQILTGTSEMAEADEVVALKQIFDAHIEQTNAPILMIDLHTTSSFSPPFAIFDDTIRNRTIVNQIPVTKVLGIIERLHGTILGFYGDKGPTTFVFEAGQHEAESSVERHISCIWLSLIAHGVIDKASIDYKQHQKVLEYASRNFPKTVETSLRFALQKEDRFKMQDGFSNFMKVRPETLLAIHNGEEIYAMENAFVFMPLYQNKGSDGFFLVKEISNFWLKVSNWIRRFKLSYLVEYLPGIQPHPSKAHTYVVNKNVAGFRTIDFLHLLGFRREKKIGKTLYVSRRPYDLTGPWDK